MYNIVFNEHLEHHGIKGQKWGIRRYQNPDGSLTDEGKKRYYTKAWYPDGTGLTPYGKRLLQPYREIGSGYKAHESELDERATEYGLTKTDKGYVLSKDTPLYRVALPGDKIDNRPKYVSYIKGDTYEYEDFAVNGQLWFDDMEGNNKGIASYKYRLKDDLKIATGRDVVSHILDKYGDTRMNKFYDIAYNYDPYTKLYKKLKDAEVKGDEATVQKYKKIRRISDTAQTEFNSTMIKNIMKTKMNEISEDYIKKGYDAITDIEDALPGPGTARHPLIILNPSKSLEIDDKRWVTTPNVSGFDYNKHKKPD